MAKSYRRTQQPGLALPHAVMVADMQLDNPQLLMFTAHTAALAGEYDVCSKWCSYLLEHIEDESVTTPVSVSIYIYCCTTLPCIMARSSVQQGRGFQFKQVFIVVTDFF